MTSRFLRCRQRDSYINIDQVIEFRLNTYSRIDLVMSSGATISLQDTEFVRHFTYAANGGSIPMVPEEETP